MFLAFYFFVMESDSIIIQVDSIKGKPIKVGEIFIDQEISEAFSQVEFVSVVKSDSKSPRYSKS